MSGIEAVVSIAGAGPAGSLLAILLCRRGYEVRMYERRADPRSRSFDSGRSINLAMAERGIHALRHAGVYERLKDAMIPMRGRMIHDRNGATQFQPYGNRPDEVIHSISRHRLNALLIDIAIRDHGAQVRFDCEVRGCDAGRRRLQLGAPGIGPHDPAGSARQWMDYDVLIGADGSHSAIRGSLAAGNAVRTRIEPLAHAYKELTIPAAAGGSHRLAREALHIWPRGDFMLIALPNPDGSFTATLFLETGRFQTLREPGAIEDFLCREFADAAALMPDRVNEFLTHPLGHLSTVYAHPWHQGRTLLLGDAAHAVVPFHGQGMNCCFEDCVKFDELLGTESAWEPLFDQFTLLRKPDTDAIAEMALENYLEMRDRVADPRFQLQKRLSLELERRHPGRFIPRYAMVSFRHDIGYAQALRRGRIQQEILDDLTTGVSCLDQVDFAQAARRIEAALPPLDPDVRNACAPAS